MAALSLALQSAYGNGLAVAGDSVTISASAGGFNEAKNLAATPGLVPATSNIPAASVNSDLTFSFDLTAATGATINTGSAYTFRAGMFIDDDANQRRLEFSISDITITFDSAGNIVSGSVAAGDNASVSGRSANGGTTANIEIANSLLNFSDTTLSIRAGAQIADIQAGDPILQDLTATINSAAAYKYGVFLKQTGGPEGLTLGLVDGTVFGCAPSNPMVLANQTNFQGAYALQGAMGIDMAAGADPAPFATGTANCTTTPALSGGGGGGGGGGETSVTPEATSTSLTDAFAVFTVSGGSISGPVDDASVSTVTATFNQVLTDVQTLVSEGNTTPALVSQLVGDQVMGSLFHMAIQSLFGSSVSTENKTALVNAVTNYRQTIKLLADSGLLTGDQLSGFNASLKTFTGQLAAQIGTSSTPLISQQALLSNNAGNGSDTSQLTVSEESTIALQRKFAVEIGGLASIFMEINGAIDSELQTSLQSFSKAMVQDQLDEIAAAINPSLNVSHETDTATRQLLTDSPALLAAVIDVAAIPLTSTLLPDQEAVQADLVNAGLDSAAAATLATNLASFGNPVGVTVPDADEMQVTALALLQSGLGNTTVAYNAATLNTVVIDDGSSLNFPVNMLAVRLVSDLVPEGLHALPNGTALVVSDGLAMTVAPAAADIVAFSAGVNSAEATISIGPNGGLTVTGADFTFSGTFGFDGLSAVSDSAVTGFSSPEGDPASTDFDFAVTYENGETQRIAPLIRAGEVYDSIIAAGFDVVTDLSTGVIFVDGQRFRPSYFIEPLTGEDSIFLSQNDDAAGVAFRPVDANGDGITDFEALTTAGKQLIFGMP